MSEEKFSILSLRIPDELRVQLENLKKASGRELDRNVTISEVAKQVLERGVGQAERAELLFSTPTEALIGIRRTVETGFLLTRAEWAFLFSYVRMGIERVHRTLVSRRSLESVLDAFLSAYKLRTKKKVEQTANDYIENLPAEFRPDLSRSNGKASPEMVEQAVQRTLQWLKDPQCKAERVEFARNLEIVIRRENFGHVGLEEMNRALMPYWPVLWRLAARGHYLTTGKPVREEPGVRPYLPKRQIASLTVGSFRLDFAPSKDNEQDLLIDCQSRRIMYPLTRYPKIIEFAEMLQELHSVHVEFSGRIIQTGQWEGEFFCGFLTEEDSKLTYWFRAYEGSITIGFTEEEWTELQTVFRLAWNEAEVRSAWDALSMEYGELEF